MSRYEACGKFGEHERGVRVAQGTEPSATVSSSNFAKNDLHAP